MDFFHSLAICFLGSTHKTGQLVDPQSHPHLMSCRPMTNESSILHTPPRIIPKHFSSCRTAAFCVLRTRLKLVG
jgi:hypothetical protein